MGKPTEDELEQAIREAAHMREQGDDPHHIAKVLLNMNYRFKRLEHVLAAVEHYLHSGHAEQEHRRLIRAVEAAREAEHRSAGEDWETYGLG